MATLTVPLHPGNGDAQAAAELERALSHVPDQAWRGFARWVEDCLRATEPARRHELLIVDQHDDAHLWEPLVWVDGRLEPRPHALPAIACRWLPPAAD